MVSGANYIIKQDIYIKCATICLMWDISSDVFKVALNIMHTLHLMRTGLPEGRRTVSLDVVPAQVRSPASSYSARRGRSFTSGGSPDSRVSVCVWGDSAGTEACPAPGDKDAGLQGPSGEPLCHGLPSRLSRVSC